MGLAQEHSAAPAIALDYAYTLVHTPPERAPHGARLDPIAASIAAE
jgi:hypothetical protein